MKANLVYSVVFLLTFVLVTAVINFMNLQYNNIFRFDFRDIQDVAAQEAEDSLEEGSYYETYGVDSNNVTQMNIYHTVIRDSVVKVVVQDSSLVAVMDSIQFLINKLQRTNEEFKESTLKMNQLNVVKSKNSVDSIYNAWIRKTANIYNTMDPDDAAKIIEGYSDNIAKDIIYKMKKKKAALVLAALSPQIAKNITRAR